MRLMNVNKKCVQNIIMKDFDKGVLLGERNENGEQDNVYYKTYTGPNIDSANIEGEDVTKRIKELYGEMCNWCEKLYTVKSLCNSEYVGKQLHIEFKRRNPNIPEFTTMFLETLDMVINPPLFMPYDVR